MPYTISRRQFLANTTALFGLTYYPFAWSKATPIELPIPELVNGSNGAEINLEIRNAQWSFKPGIKTQTLGFNLDYLGPTIRTRKNSELNLHYHNAIDQSVAVHGHGLHVPGEVDGGPQLLIAPGGNWQPTLSIVQQAATCWYHSHTHGKTGEQVYRGLAGMIIIDDENSDSLNLPNRYGIDDLPIIIQDRTFDSEGELVYSFDDAHEDGWLGETVVINGAISPVAKVPAGKVRLRLLNGANARFYIVQFSDNRTFHKIATDGGLLPAPVPLTSMEMSPGERCEIIVDLEDSNPASLLTLFEDEFEDEEGLVENILGLFKPDPPLPEPSLVLIPDSNLPAHTEPLPETMNSKIRPAESEIMVTRDFFLTMEGADEEGSHSHESMMINDAAMNMSVINEHVKKGVWERWRVRSDAGAHPFHVHGCSFLIEQMEGADAPLDQQGWKDMVVADDDDWATILVRFEHEASEKYPYMYHCHILEHEDMGMMGQFTVSA